MNDDLSYLLGSYFGDGHIDYKKSAYQFSITSEDLDFLVYNNEICLKEFGKQGNIKKVGNHYKLVICSKLICNFILDYMCSNGDFKTANKYERKGRIPELDAHYHLSFIQGLMDSDGWICAKKNGKYVKYEIGFKNSSDLTPSIYEFMKQAGLSCTKILPRKGDQRTKNGRAYNQSRPTWAWYITPFDYISKIGFRIERKRNIANQYLKDRGYI